MEAGSRSAYREAPESEWSGNGMSDPFKISQTLCGRGERGEKALEKCVYVCVPGERGEMCLTYAQHTLPGRQEQQDTINDRRIRLLQYGLPRPCLPFCRPVIFHSPVSREAVYSCVLFSPSPFIAPPLSLDFPVSVIDMQQCVSGLQTLFSWSAFKTAWR